MNYGALMPKSERGSTHYVPQNSPAFLHYPASAVSPKSNHHRVQKYRSPNKYPPKSKDEWNRIWHVIEYIYSQLNATGEETLTVLDVAYGFEVSINTFKNELKDRGRKKNNQGQTQLTLHSDAHLSPKLPRTRPAVRPGVRLYPSYQNKPYPMYVLAKELSRRPSSLQPNCYRPQTRLVFHVMKYINGFFDNASRRNMDDVEIVCYRAQLYSIRCQEIYGVLRRKRQTKLIEMGNPKKRHLRFNENACLKAGIADVLTERVFGPLNDDLNKCSPQILGFLWNISRVLHELSSQLEIPQKRRRSTKERAARAERRQSRGASWKRPEGPCDSTQDILSSFLYGIQQSQGRPEDGHRELLDIFRAMGKIEPNELRHTIRVVSLCTARTLSNWLEKDDPVLLKTWAAYYRHWGRSGLNQEQCLNPEQFIASYRRALQRAKQKYGAAHDYSVGVLCDFVEAAQAVCNDEALVQSLARELWDRTATSYQQMLQWSPQARGLATAAQALAQSSLANYTNARHAYMVEIRGRLGRHKSHVFLALNPKPGPRNADHVAETLKAAIRSLDGLDWDCGVALAALHETFGRCDNQFFYGREAAKHYLDAKKFRISAIFHPSTPNYHKIVKSLPS